MKNQIKSGKSNGNDNEPSPPKKSSNEWHLSVHTPHYENVPFEVPENWAWTTVSDISKSILYGVSESAKTKGKYKLLRITDIQNNRVDWDSVPFTDFDEDKVSSYLTWVRNKNKYIFLIIRNIAIKVLNL